MVWERDSKIVYSMWYIVYSISKRRGGGRGERKMQFESKITPNVIAKDEVLKQSQNQT